MASELPQRDDPTTPPTTMDDEAPPSPELSPSREPAPEFPDDYSDALSPNSDSQGPQSHQRRYQRGGRKKSTHNTRGERGANGRIPPLSETREGGQKEEQAQTDDDFDPEADLLTPPPSHSHSQPRRRPKEPKERKEESASASAKEAKRREDFVTGIRAFNVRKATGSGGRPLGVKSVPHRPKKTTTTTRTEKSKEVTREGECSDPEMFDIEEEEEEEREPEQKPMRIRLDLNIVLEVFLKAKIQGDVTITFLE